MVMPNLKIESFIKENQCEQFKFFLMLNPIKVLIHHPEQIVYRNRISLLACIHRVTFINERIAYATHDTVSGKTKYMNGSKAYVYENALLYKINSFSILPYYWQRSNRTYGKNNIKVSSDISW